MALNFEEQLRCERWKDESRPLLRELLRLDEKAQQWGLTAEERDERARLRAESGRLLGDLTRYLLRDRKAEDSR